jgi:hypothetical protein
MVRHSIREKALDAIRMKRVRIPLNFTLPRLSGIGILGVDQKVGILFIEAKLDEPHFPPFIYLALRLTRSNRSR